MTKDIFSTLNGKNISSDGIFDSKIKLVCEGTLKKIDMRALVDYFRNKADGFATGEFWGKMMRNLCLIASYTDDAELRKIIDDTASDMMSIQGDDGELSTVPKDKQPNGSKGSDLWERKYALMGLLAYYELSGNKSALEAARNLALYTARQVGPAPKREITDTGWAFYGIESSSILEVIMRTYSYTGDKELLEFGRYIIDSGACKRENIFKAIENGKSPYMIGSNGVAKESIAKAYEMMSCFEGLIEFYRVTGEADKLLLAEKFWDVVEEEEITLLGSGGADAPHNLGPGIGEQWNKTKSEQTNPDIDLMMETCVTVYWMRLSHNLLRATGNAKYADAIEVSLYNAIIGALKYDGSYFEYFPRFNGYRNTKVNFSSNINGFDLSCCTANGPTGLAAFATTAVMKYEKGYAINFYESLSFQDGENRFDVISNYPSAGNASIKILSAETEKLSLKLRIPSFSSRFSVSVNSEQVKGSVKLGYFELFCLAGDTVTVSFDIPLTCHEAPIGSNRKGDDFVAFKYGAIMLSLDSRLLSDIDSVSVPCRLPDSYEVKPSEFGGFFNIYTKFDNEDYTFVDYMSAGNSWNENKFLSWIPKR